MRLKKIRLAGFKSFVDPTNIPFPGDMTAIVGPNGCGKSNVIDAVRWVLGESSAKNLRGDSMTDVIFNGSSSRKAVSQCSVELVFDNTSQRIGGEFAAYSEISVKRVVTKDAVSSYFLNSSKCRRKDITDLFLGTGLGPRSYAIIEQGMISRLIESKPQELRVFIEEAAGISKYKERRKETLSRIKQTKENLDRLEDVRQALGEHIAKLKRQASAANKYKELKQQERLLKAELATLKWRAQSDIMEDARAQIENKQQTLFDIVASQQGEQSSLQALKNDQSLIKQSIDDVQQKTFAVASEITKLEQSQLFAQKRAKQIESEIVQITHSESSLGFELKSLSEEMRKAQEKRMAIEPEKEVIEEQLFELEDKKLDADTRLEEQLVLAKEKDIQFYANKQLLQQKHSQIQQTLSLQARTETRLNELEDELITLSDSELDKELEGLKQQREDLTTKVTQQETEHKNLIDDVKRATLLHQASLNSYEDVRNELASIKAKHDALASLQVLPARQKDEKEKQEQKAITDLLSVLGQKTLWEFFRIEAGGEKMLNTVLQELSDAWVIDAVLSPKATIQWPSGVWHDMPQGLLFKDSFSAHKKPGTLASLLTNTLVPALFNQYYIADDDKQALSMLNNIGENERVVTRNGHIFTQDSFIKHQQGDNKIARAAQIEALAQEYEAQAQRCIAAEKRSVETLNSLNSINDKLNEVNKALSLSMKNQQNVEIKYQNTLFQQQQCVQRSEKINTEIAQHQERVGQESMSLELLNDDIEQASEDLLLLEQAKDDASTATISLRNLQQQWQAQHTQMQSRLHEQAMAIQQVRNTLQILQEQCSNKEQQLADNAEKLSLLQLEEQDLLIPQEKQTEKLQSLLQEHEQLRAYSIVKREALSTIQNRIGDIEKGQHGTVAKMDEIKADIESGRIRLESANVRAQSFLEQLTELKQSVKDVIKSLPQDANEQSWENQLQATTASVTRLGAVNLAAVDEYETQSVRKEHLDAQNLDLTQALDTLQSAMLKIDKETRSRFKHTFDAVNNDLKSLFPKVFGGGMAYLALNDDDMLETGVTIMARPPGKKNSTIGLLSGGEKALTALSLVFAIFRLNPAPFCLLDEVDAPLDDANVGRFCRLVSQMSQSVQFIYITHNKVAMEMATHLTGVTMAEPGVSRMVAVDMEQALEIAE